MANYAFGNGFSVEGMAGYDTNPKFGQTNQFVSYLKFGYGVSF